MGINTRSTSLVIGFSQGLFSELVLVRISYLLNLQMYFSIILFG